MGLFLAAGSIMRFFNDGEIPSRHGIYRASWSCAAPIDMYAIRWSAACWPSCWVRQSFRLARDFRVLRVFAFLNAVYMPLWEESGRIARFGDDYGNYQRQSRAGFRTLRHGSPTRGRKVRQSGGLTG